MAEDDANQGGGRATGGGASDPPNPTATAKSEELLAQLLELVKENQAKLDAVTATGYYNRFMQFAASGVFFMLVGFLFLLMAYLTVGHTFASMSFVLVVVGVGILLFGTGTQGVGDLVSGQDATSLFKYKIALAGGAGITAFCVAGGIIAYHDQMKRAFQIEQGYLRLDIYGKGVAKEDMSHYLPEITVNGEVVPAVRRGRYIEAYVPYFFNDNSTFEIQAKLHLIDEATSLLLAPEGNFKVVLKTGGEIIDDDEGGHKYDNPGGFDFPRYALRTPIQLKDDLKPRDYLGGNAPR